MALTRVFLSSTSTDLSEMRRILYGLIDDLGHQPVAFERPDFFSNPTKDTCEACKAEVEKSDLLIMVIDRKYGTKYKGTNKSITRVEFETARVLGIPTFVLVSKSALTASELYKQNRRRKDVDWGVDDPDLFDFIDEIKGSATGNWVQEYANTDDAKKWVKGQLSSLLKDCLSRANVQTNEIPVVPVVSGRRKRPAQEADESRSGLPNVLRTLSRMSYSYKPVLVISLWENPKVDGYWTLEEVSRLFHQFYLNRHRQGLLSEVEGSELWDPAHVSEHTVMRVCWEGPIDALRGTLLETSGRGSSARVRFSQQFLELSTDEQQVIIDKAQVLLISYYRRTLHPRAS